MTNTLTASHAPKPTPGYQTHPPDERPRRQSPTEWSDPSGATPQAETPRASRLYHRDLAWYLQQRDSDCGVRSAHGAFVARIERGDTPGAPPGGTPREYDDGQVGLGPAQRQAFQRDREIRTRWLRLPEEHRVTLRAHYQGLAPSDPATAQPVPWRARFREWDREQLLATAEGQLAQLVWVVLTRATREEMARWLSAWERHKQPTDLGAAADRARDAVARAHAAYRIIEAWDATASKLDGAAQRAARARLEAAWHGEVGGG